MQTIHLPVIFAALLDLLHVCHPKQNICSNTYFSQSQVQNDPTKASSQSVFATWLLLGDILQRIPHAALLQRPEMTAEFGSDQQRSFDFACTFFRITDKSLPIADAPQLSAIPFLTCFRSLITLSICYSDRLSQERHDSLVLCESYIQLLSLLDRLAARLDAPIDVNWNPKVWLDKLLESLETEVAFLPLSLACALNFYPGSYIHHCRSSDQPNCIPFSEPIPGS
jgi:hypothetical protein